jgi:hypothetical protein
VRKNVFAFLNSNNPLETFSHTFHAEENLVGFGSFVISERIHTVCCSHTSGLRGDKDIAMFPLSPFAQCEFEEMFWGELRS